MLLKTRRRARLSMVYCLAIKYKARFHDSYSKGISLMPAICSWDRVEAVHPMPCFQPTKLRLGENYDTVIKINDVTYFIMHFRHKKTLYKNKLVLK